MKLNRLLSIVLLIESKKHVTAKELSTLFEVSMRTIYRDIDLLCEAGVPIYATSGPKGGFSFIEGYQLDSKTLDKQDMEKLLLSVYGQMLKEHSMESTVNAESTFLLKLRKILPKKEQENFERLLQTTRMDSVSWWGKEKEAKGIDAHETTIDLIQKSIYQLKQVSFDYVSHREVTNNRILYPYRVVHKGNAWYVVGFSKERNEIRTFHTERMHQVKLTDESYEIPNDFDLESYWERSTREFVRVAAIHERKPVHNLELNVAQEEVNYRVHLIGTKVIDRILAGFTVIDHFDDQRGSHYIVDLISERTALSIVLLHLDQVFIEEPVELRDKVIEFAKKIVLKQNFSQ